MKLQWKSVSEEQERRNSRLRDYRSLIGEKHDVQFLIYRSFINLSLTPDDPVYSQLVILEAEGMLMWREGGRENLKCFILDQITFSPSALWLFAEKDVNRTDRTNRFYEGIDNPGLVLLHDILMTYCMYDFDLGETPSFSCGSIQ